ncbi:TIGR03083 family protein [Blastococcus sp. DSM 46786]|uniref:maleylpyruvate isomerase family mycothiol-dependent enzyme n=1 Tax=Blastococcus sp. DSM 46786 TaxID=1798227 RepID=UPI0008D839A7|nr:maleylpyruvate isomerase family mycothiol-dependent enzyme [Blastococcus sp. DSM 46786]SEL23504.1 TIGR03083 family protein [Blastococcus sp. DSM 46786]
MTGAGDADPDEVRAWVARTYGGLADLLDAEPGAWDGPSLCAGWRARHVVAHVTMPARLTPEQFGAELAAAGGDFTLVSDTVAGRDATLPAAELLAALRSPVLHRWQPPGGGAAGALTHAVVHSLDVTVALDRPPVAPDDAVLAVLDHVAAADGAVFGVDLTGARLDATDAGWSRGEGEVVRADSGRLVALLAGRTLPDGRALRRRYPRLSPR